MIAWWEGTQAWSITITIKTLSALLPEQNYSSPLSFSLLSHLCAGRPIHRADETILSLLRHLLPFQSFERQFSLYRQS